MEHRKEYGSPRDMLDDALLQRILADMSDSRQNDNHCGCGGSERSARGNQAGEQCGYQNNERSARNDRSGEQCGCQNNERSTRNERSGEQCGYLNNERSARNERSGEGSRNNDRCSFCRQSRQSCSTCRDRNTENTESRMGTDYDSGCRDSCISGRSVPLLSGFPLAMVYSPNQEWDGIMEPEEAHAKGTLFSGLVFPWYPSRCHEDKSCGCGRD